MVDPLPDYVAIVHEAQYWGVTPDVMLDMPVEWVEAGRIVREAQRLASAKDKGNGA